MGENKIKVSKFFTICCGKVIGRNKMTRKMYTKHFHLINNLHICLGKYCCLKIRFCKDCDILHVCLGEVFKYMSCTIIKKKSFTKGYDLHIFFFF